MADRNAHLLGEILSSEAAEKTYDHLADLLATAAGESRVIKAKAALRECIVAYLEKSRGMAPSGLVNTLMHDAINDIEMDLLNEQMKKPPGKGR